MANVREYTREERLVEVCKALADQTRLRIASQIAGAAELPCTALERSLPVTKPTISYHIKLLHQAGIIEVRRAGRNYFYTFRQDVLDDVIPGMTERLRNLQESLPEQREPRARPKRAHRDHAPTPATGSRRAR